MIENNKISKNQVTDAETPKPLLAKHEWTEPS